MTMYHGGDVVDRAQAVLDAHAVSSADGLCVACRVPGPCGRYEGAAAVFAQSLRLPRRIPGVTRPELIGARRVGFRGLLSGVG